MSPFSTGILPLQPNADAIYAELYWLLRNHSIPKFELHCLPLSLPLIVALARIFTANNIHSMEWFSIRECSFHAGEEAWQGLLDFLNSGTPCSVGKFRFFQNHGLTAEAGGMEFLDGMLRTKALLCARAVYIVSTIYRRV